MRYRSFHWPHTRTRCDNLLRDMEVCAKSRERCRYYNGSNSRCRCTVWLPVAKPCFPQLIRDLHATDPSVGAVVGPSNILETTSGDGATPAIAGPVHGLNPRAAPLPALRSQQDLRLRGSHLSHIATARAILPSCAGPDCHAWEQRSAKTMAGPARRTRHRTLLPMASAAVASGGVITSRRVPVVWRKRLG